MPDQCIDFEIRRNRCSLQLRKLLRNVFKISGFYLRILGGPYTT